MLSRIEPLRNELASLENAAKENRKKNDDMQKLIKELEHSIAKYKEEYALLISQAQAIKADLAAVEAKVSNFLKLWDNHIYISGPKALKSTLII